MLLLLACYALTQRVLSIPFCNRNSVAVLAQSLRNRVVGGGRYRPRNFMRCFSGECALIREGPRGLLECEILPGMNIGRTVPAVFVVALRDGPSSFRA